MLRLRLLGCAAFVEPTRIRRLRETDAVFFSSSFSACRRGNCSIHFLVPNRPSSNPLKLKIPLLDKSLAELIDFDTFLKQSLTNATTFAPQPDGTTAAPFANSTQLLNLLRGLAGVGVGNANIAATPADIAPITGSYYHQTAVPHEMQASVEIIPHGQF